MSILTVRAFIAGCFEQNVEQTEYLYSGYFPAWLLADGTIATGPGHHSIAIVVTGKFSQVYEEMYKQGAIRLVPMLDYRNISLCAEGVAITPAQRQAVLVLLRTWNVGDESVIETNEGWYRSCGSKRTFMQEVDKLFPARVLVSV